jgi:hypothetical protein
MNCVFPLQYDPRNIGHFQNCQDVPIYPSHEMYAAVVVPGNNSELVTQLLEERQWRILDTDADASWEECDLMWKQGTKKGIWKMLRVEQGLNHLLNHNVITAKDSLIDILSHSCPSVSTFVPPSFIISKEEQAIGVFRNAKRIMNSCGDSALSLGENVWIVKPTSDWGGSGIHVVHNIGQYRSAMRRQRHQRLILQKYVEKPLLIEKYKFDLRLWVLMDHSGQIWMHRYPYLRRSIWPYDLQDPNLAVHLTNWVVQQKENAAIDTIIDWEQWNYDDRAKVSIWQAMRECVQEVFQAAQKPLLASLESFPKCFELFGFDFMLDASCHVWLLEVNTNPSLSTGSSNSNSPVLQRRVPAMLEALFSLTIDQIFPPTAEKDAPSSQQDLFESVVHLRQGE